RITVEHIVRQLRSGEREEHEHEPEPEQQISLQLIGPDRANTHRDQNDERRERQAEERERWKVVEQAAAMPRDRSAEAADVMLDEETLDEAAPFLEQNHHV